MRRYLSTGKTVSPSQLAYFYLQLIVPMAHHLAPHPRSPFMFLEAGQLPGIPHYLITSQSGDITPLLS